MGGGIVSCWGLFVGVARKNMEVLLLLGGLSSYTAWCITTVAAAAGDRCLSVNSWVGLDTPLPLAYLLDTPHCAQKVDMG